MSLKNWIRKEAFLPRPSLTASADRSDQRIRIGRMKQKFGQQQTRIHKADRLKLSPLTVQK